MELSGRQEQIIAIVKEHQPVTAEKIAGQLSLTRAALRPDLAILTKSGILEARPNVGYCFVRSSSFLAQGQRMQSRTVAQVMSPPVVIRSSDTIYSAVIALFTADAGSLFVVDEGDLVGIISRKDLLKSAIGGLDMHSAPVAMAMTRRPNIIYATGEELVAVVVQRLLERQVDTLPVVEREMTEAGERLRVVGRFTKSAVTRLFMDMISG